MPDKDLKSFREVDHGKIHARARLGFVKPIQDGLRKKQSLVKNTQSRTETSLVGRENGVKFQKEEFTC